MNRLEGFLGSRIQVTKRTGRNSNPRTLESSNFFRRKEVLMRKILCGVLIFTFLFVIGVLQSGAAEKEVTYLSLADYTAAIAGLNVPGDMGTEDYFKDLNAKGGVDGVKVKFIGVDTRYDVARGVSAYKRYRAEPKLLVANAIGTPIGKAVAPLATKDKIVQLVPGDGEFQANLGRIFVWGPTYQDAFAATVDWLLADWKKKGKTGMPKLGFISWDSAYGKEPLRGGKEYAEKMGVAMAPPEFFPPGTMDHTVYLSRLAKAEVNYIFAGGVDPTPTNVIRDAHKLGLTKTIQFFCDYWGPTSLGTRLHPEALEGTVIVSYYIRGDDARKHPMANLWTKYGRGKLEDMNEVYTIGMIWAMTFEAGLKIALKEVGYKKLDGEAMYQAYQKLTGQKWAGLQGPCAYSPTSRRGSWEVRFYQVKAGKVVSISDWIKAPDAVSLHKF
jgi:branched-chain amino acid transport system substrate-binding protein